MEERVDVFFNILFFLELTTCLPETSRIHNNVNKTQDEIQQKKYHTNIAGLFRIIGGSTPRRIDKTVTE